MEGLHREVQPHLYVMKHTPFLELANGLVRRGLEGGCRGIDFLLTQLPQLAI